MNESTAEVIKSSYEAFFAPQSHEYATTQLLIDTEDLKPGMGPAVIQPPQGEGEQWDLFEVPLLTLVSSSRDWCETTRSFPRRLCMLYTWTWVRACEGQPSKLEVVRAVLQDFEQRMSQLATQPEMLHHCLDVIDKVKAVVG